MAKRMIERRLVDTGDRLKKLRAELAVADEQCSHFDTEADDARLRAMVSETPLSEREFRDAQRHADAMRRHREDLDGEIGQLERQLDELLDKLTAGG